jgi:hypothetical protein
MKAKISKVSPVGEVNETKTFYIPHIKKSIKQKIKLKDGSTIYGEPMKVNRYLLEIGNYKYWIRRTGEIELIDVKMC